MTDGDRSEHSGAPDRSPTAEWVRDARRTIRASEVDFFRVSPMRYWADFLMSIVIAYTCATIYLTFPLGSWPQLVAFPFAVFWLYRLGSLVHEVCHLGHYEMRGFKVAWNLAVGVLTLTPSPFFTRHHRDHHSQRMYGTHEDPEYMGNVLEGGNWRSAMIYGLHVLLFPILVFLRFLLAPLSFLHPKLRQFVLERASSLTLNFRYRRKVTDFDRRAITVTELLCCLRAAIIPLGVLASLSPVSRIPLLYVLGLTTFLLNQMRLLADHHVLSDGSPSDVESHILDSCNFTGNDWLTWLFFPFSIRYHALHHLFPSLPYHNLKQAHQYLAENLPADSPYHTLDQPNWWSVARSSLFGRAAIAKA